MDKIQKIETGAIRLSEMTVSPRTDRDAGLAEKLIETLTDQVCDSVTESLEAVQKAIERRIIIRVLKKTGGNQTHAAKLIGVSRTTLISKLKKLKIAIIDEIHSSIPLILLLTRNPSSDQGRGSPFPNPHVSRNTIF